MSVLNEHLFKKPDNRLEQLIQEKGYTLKQISSEINIPITTLSGYKKNLELPKKIMQKFLLNILMFQFLIFWVWMKPQH